MKKKILIFNLILVFVLISGFSVFAEDTLSRVKSTGTLKFGTSADYIPFVFRDSNDQMTGMDVELVREVARRMGVQLKVVDMAFDGLFDAVNIGQVDLIGGGIAVTDDRAQKAEFSRRYYSSAATMIAKAGTQVPNPFTLESLKGKKFGTEKGTYFDQWVATNLVEAGFISPTDVYKYRSEAEAVQALNRGDVDLAILDDDVYEKKYKNSGSYVVYETKVVDQSYAFASEKGSTLIPEINRVLNEMLKDGTAQNIANKFFNMSFEDIQPSIVRQDSIATATPVPAAPAIPVPAVSSCVNAMSFMADMSIPDGHQIAPGEKFTKTWRIYNNGSCTWTGSYGFVFVSGDNMGGPNIMIPGTVNPGQTVDLSVPMVGPSGEGTYKGYWQMRSPQGQQFGQTIWVKVRVRGGNPAPRPVQPTQAPVQPTQGPRPVSPTQAPVYPTDEPIPPATINCFYPDTYSGEAGYCPTIYWDATDTMYVDVYVDGNLKGTYPATGSASGLCDWIPGKTLFTFRLDAISNGGTASSSFNYESKPLAPIAPTEEPYVEPTAEPYVEPTEEPYTEPDDGEMDGEVDGDFDGEDEELTQEDLDYVMTLVAGG